MENRYIFIPDSFLLSIKPARFRTVDIYKYDQNMCPLL